MPLLCPISLSQIVRISSGSIVISFDVQQIAELEVNDVEVRILGDLN